MEQYLSKIKVIRRIAGKIIEFLAQLEDFQKKLWLKKKFVVETSYCIRLGVIPEEFYPEIAANDSQGEEWVQLCAINEIEGDLMTRAYGVSLTPEFLSDHLTLAVDTRHFGADFTARLLAALGELDEQSDGVLFHSENFQALTASSTRYRHAVDVVFADPPYNTGVDGFPYKDTYQHSSWLSMMENRLAWIKALMSDLGLVFLTVDYVEVSRLRLLCDAVLGGSNFLADIAWEKRYTRSNNAKRFYSLKDTVLCYRASERLDFIRESRSEKSKANYANPDKDPRGPWISSSYVNPATKEERPNLVYPIHHPFRAVPVEHPTHAWKYDPTTHQEHVQSNRLYWGIDGDYDFPRLKSFLSDAADGMVPIDVWHHKVAGTTDDGGNCLKALFGSAVFDNPKPNLLIERAVSLSPEDHASLVV
ncbi:MAG: site-specific DNA-methyltransferase, partial [Bryobacteraceae bacterium]